jgi:hypothetical protein
MIRRIVISLGWQAVIANKLNPESVPRAGFRYNNATPINCFK